MVVQVIQILVLFDQMEGFSTILAQKVAKNLKSVKNLL